MRVDLWSDVVCPWCYVGKRRLESALAAFEGRADVEVVQRSFQLNPTAPRDHTSSRTEMLMKKYGLTSAQAEAADVRMAQIAAQEGLDFRLNGLVTGNTFDAHQLLHLARDRARQDAMVERLYRAYFVDQRSVFDRNSLVELAQDAGVEADAARETLQGDRYADAVAADINEARRLGITGVPFYVIDGRHGISGAQPAAVFVEAFRRAAAESAGARN